MKAAITTACVSLLVFALPHTGSAEVPVTEAISALTERLEANPRDAGLLTDYANLLTRDGRFDEALASYKLSLEMDPDSAITLYNLGLLEFELGMVRPAGRRLRRALHIDEDFARAHYALGTVLASRHRHHRAVKHFARAFSLDAGLLEVDHNPEILFNRLATWASVRSYLNGSPQRGTRLYVDPQPIVGLLVPALELLEAAPEPEPAAEEAVDGDGEDSAADSAP